MRVGIKQKQHGFTIVELLIVIVVIGILAAISIVAYTGVQNRARNTQILSGMNTYVKALATYTTDKGVYPVPTGFIACFGGINNCNGSANATYTAQLATELLPYLSNASTLLSGAGSLINYTSNYAMPDGGAAFTGMYIYFIQYGTSTCPAPNSLRPMWSSVSGTSDVVCRFALPVVS
jgi:prepilin-type N-terminal cleavage/methylation domain-containing protein